MKFCTMLLLGLVSYSVLYTMEENNQLVKAIFPQMRYAWSLQDGDSTWSVSMNEIQVPGGSCITSTAFAEKKQKVASAVFAIHIFNTADGLESLFSLETPNVCGFRQKEGVQDSAYAGVFNATQSVALHCHQGIPQRRLKVMIGELKALQEALFVQEDAEENRENV